MSDDRRCGETSDRECRSSTDPDDLAAELGQIQQDYADLLAERDRLADIVNKHEKAWAMSPKSADGEAILLGTRCWWIYLRADHGEEDTPDDELGGSEEHGYYHARKYSLYSWIAVAIDGEDGECRGAEDDWEPSGELYASFAAAVEAAESAAKKSE